MRIRVNPTKMITIEQVNYMAGQELDALPEVARALEILGDVTVIKAEKRKSQTEDAPAAPEQKEEGAQ